VESLTGFAAAVRNRRQSNTDRTDARADMKILLQHVPSQLFYGRANVWTSDPEAAMDFKHSEALFDFVEAYNLHNVQLVAECDHPQRYEIVPLELARTAPFYRLSA
jgi:hypothetical protein